MTPRPIITLTRDLITAAERLIEALLLDDSSNGGLLSRETIRKSDELRVVLLRWRRRVVPT